MSKTKTVISKEVALKEIETLINRFVKKPVKFDEIEETYPDILDAIMDGYLSFDGTGIPVLKLKEPVTSESGTVVLETVNFRTRVKPTTLRDLGKGLDLKKDPFGLGIRITAYITDQPEMMVDNYSKYDYGVIDQICSIFS
jgi:hypothetical protein